MAFKTARHEHGSAHHDGVVEVEVHYAGDLSLGGRLEHGMPDVPAGAMQALEGSLCTLLETASKNAKRGTSCKVPGPLPNPAYCVTCLKSLIQLFKLFPTRSATISDCADVSHAVNGRSNTGTWHPQACGE